VCNYKVSTHYKAFGLTISSDIQLPELILTEIEVSAPDVVIAKTDLNAIWGNFKDSIQFFMVKENLVLFKVPNTAIFLIENGNRILYMPIDDCNEDEIRLFLLGTCMGAILLMRKILPLHGSAIAINGKAYAIVGDSGAGKSTLAAAFLKEGFQLLSDDIIPIMLSQDNKPIVIPAYPQQKLWVESLHIFGMDSNLYQPITQRESKFIIPISSNYSSDPMPLAGIFELNVVDNESINTRIVNKLEQFELIYRHTYRNFFISPLGRMNWHFQTSGNIVSDINSFQIERLKKSANVNALQKLILSIINKVPHEIN